MDRKGPVQFLDYLKNANSPAKLLEFSGSVHSVEGAAKELGTDPAAAIKTLIFISDDKRAVAAIIPGQCKGDRKKIEAACGCKLHFASPEEALAFIGYAVGGTPPVGNHASIVIIDPQVIARTTDSFGGGGDDRHLLKISSAELARLNPGALVIDVSKDQSALA